MGVRVEEEWRYKRVRSKRASRSAFAYKINRRVKEKAQNPKLHGYGGTVPYSREVILKITGGARSKKGIKNGLQYISKDWQEEIIDSNGIRYKRKEEIEGAVSTLQGNVVRGMKSDGSAEKLTHNLIFSASIVAGVSKEDMVEAIVKTLKEKYPDNYFVCAYHDDTKKPHVHVVLNIHKDNGKKIDIKNKDFHEIRRDFCRQLVEQGYDLEASRRYKDGKYNLEQKDYEELKRENKNVYQVVEFGTESYQLDQRNDKNCYLIYKTSNDKEVTIWGKELLDEVRRSDIKKGDLVKIKKIGQVAVKVPVYGDDGAKILSWRVAKRNCWQIERAGGNFTFSKVYDIPQEIQLDSPEQFAKQVTQKEKFEHEKQIFLGLSPEEKLSPELELRHKLPDQKFRF